MISRKKLVGISLTLCLGFTALMAVKSMFFSSRREIVVKTSHAHETDSGLEDVEFSEDLSPEFAEESDQELQSSNLNINSATASEFEALPGIGPVLAEEIVNYREKNGPFKSIEEIINVSGIGKAKFNAISEYITVGEREK